MSQCGVRQKKRAGGSRTHKKEGPKAAVTSVGGSSERKMSAVEAEVTA